MLGLGCFIPFVTLIIGAGVGSYFGDVRGGYWGAGAGFAVGLLIAGAAFGILDRVRRY